MAINTKDAFAEDELIPTKDAFGEEDKNADIRGGLDLLKSGWEAAKGMAKSATVDLVKNIPGMVKQTVLHPIETEKGTIKGIGKQVAGLVNPVISGVKYIATNPLVQKLPEIPTDWTQPSNQAQRTAEQTVESGTNALMLLPTAMGLKNLVGGTMKGAGAVGTRVAERIQGTKTPILMPEFKKGAANKMFTKYEVFGNAKKVAPQWQQKIDDITGSMSKQLKAQADNPENYSSVDEVFGQAENTIKNSKYSNTEKARSLQSLQDLRDEFNTAYPDGKISVLDAQKEKIGVGKKGDWIAVRGAMRANRDASADVQAHNALYDGLKKTVENKGGPDIKEMNKQLSEIIPMERSASKRILVEDRKHFIELDDFLGGIHAVASAASGNLAPAAIVAANIASKSPNVARAIYGVSKGLKKTGEFLSPSKNPAVLKKAAEISKGMKPPSPPPLPSAPSGGTADLLAPPPNKTPPIPSGEAKAPIPTNPRISNLPKELEGQEPLTTEDIPAYLRNKGIMGFTSTAPIKEAPKEAPSFKVPGVEEFLGEQMPDEENFWKNHRQRIEHAYGISKNIDKNIDNEIEKAYNYSGGEKGGTNENTTSETGGSNAAIENRPPITSEEYSAQDKNVQSTEGRGKTETPKPSENTNRQPGEDDQLEGTVEGGVIKPRPKDSPPGAGEGEIYPKDAAPASEIAEAISSVDDFPEAAREWYDTPEEYHKAITENEQDKSRQAAKDHLELYGSFPANLPTTDKGISKKNRWYEDFASNATPKENSILNTDPQQFTPEEINDNLRDIAEANAKARKVLKRNSFQRKRRGKSK